MSTPSPPLTPPGWRLPSGDETSRRVHAQARTRAAATFALVAICLVPALRTGYLPLALSALTVAVAGAALYRRGQHISEIEVHRQRPAGCLWAGSPTLQYEPWSDSRWLRAGAPRRRVLAALLSNGQHVASGRMRIWDDRIEWEPGVVAGWMGLSGIVLPRSAVVDVELVEHVAASLDLDAVVCTLEDGTYLDILHRDGSGISLALRTPR